MFLNRLLGNKLLLKGALFSLFSFFNQGASFLLLIILANYIAPSDYGTLSLFNTIISFLGFLVSLSTHGYSEIYNGKAATHQTKRSQFLTDAIIVEYNLKIAVHHRND